MARLGAKVIRDQLEDLHEGGVPISDVLMKELNRRIRDGLYTLLHAAKWRDRSISARRMLDRVEKSIPDYWEPARLIPGYLRVLEPEMEGAQPVSVTPGSAEHEEALRVVAAMLDRIAMLPEGEALRGEEGAQLWEGLERYGIDQYLRVSPDERATDRRRAFLEHDLAERVRLRSRPPKGPMPWP